MAIDLKKVLSISGQPGLFNYIAPARNGFIVEAMATKQRSSVPTSAKITTLADVSISTGNGLGGFEFFNMPSTRSYGFNVKMNF